MVLRSDSGAHSCNAWTADYLKITGELDVDLRSNIAAEARAKIVCERLINFTDDAGTKDALQFLMTREITHMKAFTAALESLGKPRFSIGKIPPTAILVDQFFNDSTGGVVTLVLVSSMFQGLLRKVHLDRSRVFEPGSPVRTATCWTSSVSALQQPDPTELVMR